MKSSVIVFPGSNCDRDIAVALEKFKIKNQMVWHDETDLPKSDLVVLPGGFSYGDDIAAGILLANEIKFKLIDQVTEFVDRGGLILGICNGFQVLVRSGLLPRINSQQIDQQATLAMNTSTKFECRWVNLKTDKNMSVFTEGLKNEIYLPVARAEGRFIASDPILDQLEANGQIVFRYMPSGYPNNPNGSHRNIAGVCDPTGRILGMMPHPERYLIRHNHPRWTRENLPEEGDGLAIFRNAVNYTLNF